MADVPEDLAAAIDAALAIDPAALADAELHHLTVGLERLRHRLGAATVASLAEWDQRRLWAGNGALTASVRLANEVNCSVTTASIELRRARHGVKMPATVAAISGGTLTLDHLDAFGRADQPRRHSHFERDEAGLVEKCSRVRFPAASRIVKYWEHRVDRALGHPADPPHGRLELRPRVDGNVVVIGLLDPIGAEIVSTELRRLERQLYLADKKSGTTRSTDERRAAALIEMATRSAAMPKDARRPRPLFVAHVGDGSMSELCQLRSGAVVTPEALDHHVDDAMVQSVLFGGTNVILSVSRRRRFTEALRIGIEARDLHCQHPSGCDRPPDECDLDHVVPFSHGGLTSQFNEKFECHPHNRDVTKHDHGAEPLPHTPITYLDTVRARLRWQYVRDLERDEDGWSVHRTKPA